MPREVNLHRMRRYLMILLLGVTAPVTVWCEHLDALRDMNGDAYRYAGRLNDGPVLLPASYRPKWKELRGVWIATVGNIDFGKHGEAASFQRDFRKTLSDLEERRFNAVFFQIRANNDAFYPSSINPYSRWLTGKEGRCIPGFDPLAFMIRETHLRGMKFHAWLNPYRVTGATKLTKHAYLAGLSPNNIARLHPEWVLDVPMSGGRRMLFLDPGRPEVTRHIVATVSEIASRYKVDAIVFDDYFYPYVGFGTIDETTFRRYNPKNLSLGDWRRENVTRLIAAVHDELATVNRTTGGTIRFGVSPFGIWRNRKNHVDGSLTDGKESYAVQFADTLKWVRRRYVDYVAPQLYWPFGHESAAYAALTDWWVKQVHGTGVTVYISMGVYQLGKSKIWNNPDEIVNQLRYNTKHTEIGGAILFSCGSVLTPANAVMKEGMERVWRCWRRVDDDISARTKFPRFQ